jgi:osmoprotectant transport system permease protein
VNYLLTHSGEIAILASQHLQMTLLTLGLGVLLAVPLALFVSRFRWALVPILSVLGVLYTIPSLALIILLVPLFGLNATAVVAAMVLYCQVILVRNLVVGIESIPVSVLEAARGTGMNAWQRWWWVQVPLLLPFFLAGLRLAATISIAIATIGAKFGGGGLGVLLFDGIAQAGRYDKIAAGAIAVAVLAFALNGLLLAVEQTTSRHRPPIRRAATASRSAVSS